MSNLTVYIITFLAYGALSAIFLRALFAGNAETLNRGLIANAVLLPLALHGYLLYDNLWFAGALNLGLVNALSLILWLTILVYWLAHFFYPLASLNALVLPLAGVGAMLPLILPGTRTMPQTVSWAFDAHVLAAMLAYSLFTIAALHAGLMSLVESNLHRARLPTLLRNLPPLLTMEKLLFRIIAAGFVLLTLTLLSGWVFSEQIFGKAWQFNHKVLFGFISWVVFGVLLAGHRFYGWRGRTAVSWTMIGFGFLVLAYIGSKFVLEVILHR
ncbi:MAG TPA: cytochrome c biogenesis protein CcsA [Gallionellaceae bacterium]|nr:cytochrome c biogenesis protein CcsA [Gallionellaceae bacterium]